jgi:hypothetical protein
LRRVADGVTNADFISVKASSPKNVIDNKADVRGT